MNLSKTIKASCVREAKRIARIISLGILLAIALTGTAIERTGAVKAAANATQCQYIIRPLERSFAAQGGTGSLTILAGENCPWTAISSVPWVTLAIVGGPNPLGQGRVNYSVFPNTTVTQRTGTITIAGQSVNVIQAGSTTTNCATTAINLGQSVSGTLAPGDCQSSLRIKDGAHPLADRFTFNGVAGQPLIISLTSTDVDTYLYLLDPNGSIVAQNDDGGVGGSSRIPANQSFLVLPANGTFTVEVTSFENGGAGNYNLSLTMPAGSCTYSLNSSGQGFPTTGGPGTVNVNTQTGCSAGAVSNNGWLSVSGAPASGPGAVNFTVAANTGVARTGTLSVAGATFTVTQTGTNGSACPTTGPLNPSIGFTGSTVKVAGTNFTGVTTLRFAANVAAPFTLTNDIEIIATVPTGAATGPLTISKPGCADVQTSNVTVNRLVVSVSAASFLGPALADESIGAAFGNGLATGLALAESVPLPTSMLGTTVRIKDANGVERQASLFFVSAGQINFLIPAESSNGTATVTVQSGDGVISMGTIEIARTAPGLFAANADGKGLAAAQLFRVKSDGSQGFEPVVQFSPAQGKFIPIPIDMGPPTDQVFLVVYGTGMRQRTILSAVTATLGGAGAAVLYAGETPGFIGLDQVNIPISRSLIGRGEIVLTLIVEGHPANPLTVTMK